MDWSGVDCCDVFIRLSFWRHPFTAEHPPVSKWCNVTFLQIWWKTNSSTSDGLRVQMLISGWNISYYNLCYLFFFFINATFCNILLFNTWHSYIKCALNAQILLGATVYHHYISQTSLWSLNINISHFSFYLNSMFMVIFSASAPAGSVNSPAAAAGVRWGGQRGGARGREGASQERDTETPAPPTEGAS